MFRSSSNQITFCKSLEKELSLQALAYAEAEATLSRYQDIPDQMDEWEWFRVSNALRKCYFSVVFLFQLAVMLRKGFLDVETLFSFHYKAICEGWIDKVEYLANWCGTGLDLAANFDVYEIGYLVQEVRGLVEGLNQVYADYGGDIGNKIVEEMRYESIRSQVLEHLSNYDIGSKDYAGKYVEVVPHNVGR